MGKHPGSYPPEFRHKIVELVRSGRSTNEVSREFDLSRQTITNWLKQDDLNVGRRDDGLTTVERDELSRLRRENKRLRMDAEILGKATAWFAREAETIPRKSSDS